MTNSLDLTVGVDTLAIEYARVFDAPVAAVFRAHAEPELIKQWLGPSGYDMDITEWNFVDHGGYRYVHSHPEEGSFAFNGTFHTVRHGEFILQTFEFDGVPDMVNIEYLWFDDLGGGRTRVRSRSICPTVQARDGLVEQGMATGITEGFDKLDALLESL